MAMNEPVLAELLETRDKLDFVDAECRVPDFVRDNELHASYLSLGARDRRRIDAAIWRWEAATGCPDPDNAIVDLGLALEVILGEHDDKEDVEYLIRMRAALVLESQIDARERVKTLINEIHRERRAIAEGEAPGEEIPELRADSERLVARLIRKILELGHIPVWRSIELRWGPRLPESW